MFLWLVQCTSTRRILTSSGFKGSNKKATEGLVNGFDILKCRVSHALLLVFWCALKLKLMTSLPPWRLRKAQTFISSVAYRRWLRLVAERHRVKWCWTCCKMEANCCGHRIWRLVEEDPPNTQKSKVGHWFLNKEQDEQRSCRGDELPLDTKELLLRTLKWWEHLGGWAWHPKIES